MGLIGYSVVVVLLFIAGFIGFFLATKRYGMKEFTNKLSEYDKAFESNYLDLSKKQELIEEYTQVLTNNSKVQLEQLKSVAKYMKDKYGDSYLESQIINLLNTMPGYNYDHIKDDSVYGLTPEVEKGSPLSINEILDKIIISGIESLTKDEKDKLDSQNEEN